MTTKSDQQSCLLGLKVNFVFREPQKYHGVEPDHQQNIPLVIVLADPQQSSLSLSVAHYSQGFAHNNSVTCTHNLWGKAVTITYFQVRKLKHIGTK